MKRRLLLPDHVDYCFHRFERILLDALIRTQFRNLLWSSLCLARGLHDRTGSEQVTLDFGFANCNSRKSICDTMNLRANIKSIRDHGRILEVGSVTASDYASKKCGRNGADRLLAASSRDGGSASIKLGRSGVLIRYRRCAYIY